jgi:microcystin-dependent protein
MSSTMRRYATFTAHERPVTGDIKMSFVGYDHIGWMKCDGRALSTKEFNLLFQVIGYTFGASGEMFLLPNPQGTVVGTVGTNSIPVSHPAGELVGEETHTLTIPELPAHNHGTQTATAQPVGNLELTGISGEHTHTSNATGNLDQYPSGTGFGLAYSNGQNTASTGLDGTAREPNLFAAVAPLTINPAGNHSHQLASIGGNQPHNNMQPTLFVGNTFIYNGIPTYPGFPPNPASAWPFTTGLVPPYI